MMLAGLFLLSLISCERACPECESIEVAYIAKYAACGVEIDEAPVCRRSNLETRRCQQACLEPAPCAWFTSSSHTIRQNDYEFQVYFDCTVACSDWSSFETGL